MVHKSKYYKKVYSEKKCSHPCPHSPLPQVITFFSFWCFLPGFFVQKYMYYFPSFLHKKRISALYWTLLFHLYDFLNLSMIIVYSGVL